MKIVILILLSILFSQSLKGQTKVGIRQFLEIKPKVKVKEDHGKYFRKADDELEMLLGSLFFVYKTSISSQDGETCSFTPSCSEYAVKAVKKLGPIKGVMSYFDRYTRCNSFYPNEYKKDYHKSRLIDEVGAL